MATKKRTLIPTVLTCGCSCGCTDELCVIMDIEGKPFPKAEYNIRCGDCFLHSKPVARNAAYQLEHMRRM